MASPLEEANVESSCSALDKVRADLKASLKSDSGRKDPLQGSFLRRHESGSIIVQSLLKEDSAREVKLDEHDVEEAVDVNQWSRTCGCWWSGNMRVLAVTAMLFIIITIAQTVAAEIAKSKALLADCVSMGVDALTYFLNIFVEMLEGKPYHRPVQLAVPVISIGILTYFTCQVLGEGVATLQEGEEGGDDVNPWIVFAFAVWGIIFDVVSIYVFWRNSKRSGSSLGINMMAAFLHVGADLARSCTTFVESILIIGFGFNGTRTDAWACCIVSATILLAALCATAEWLMDAFGCKREEK